MTSKSSRNNKSSSNTNNSQRRRRQSSNDKSKQQQQQPSSRNNIMSPTPYTSTPPNNNTAAAATNTKKVVQEDSITTDDLEAMKAMIGDIKKDPSLLYRLSNLSASPPDNSVRGATTNNNGGGQHLNFTSPAPQQQQQHRGPPSSSVTNTSLKFNTDDATEVSSIGMMSSDDYNSYLHPTPSSRTTPIKLLGGVNRAEFANACVAGLVNTSTTTTTSAFTNSSGQEGRVPIPMSPETPNQSRTNRDAEIALRMQSLRAMRDWNKQQQGMTSPQGNNGGRRISPTNTIVANHGGGVVVATTATTTATANSSTITSPTASSSLRNDTESSNNHQEHSPKSRPPPIQSPQPMEMSSSSSSVRRREGKSSSSSSSRSRRKDASSSNNYHDDDDDVDNNNIRNKSGGGNEDAHNDDLSVEDSPNSREEKGVLYTNNDGMGGNNLYTAPQHIRGGGGRSNHHPIQDDGSFDGEEDDDDGEIGDLYVPTRHTHHHRGGGGGGSSNNGSNNRRQQQEQQQQEQQQQQQEDERTLRRISEATTESEMPTYRDAHGSSSSSSNSRRSGAVQVALAAAEARKGGGGGGGKDGSGNSSSRSGGNRSSRGSPRGNTTRSRSSASRSNKGGGSGVGDSRRPEYQRSASQRAYISGSASVQDGQHYRHPQQQQQQQQQQPLHRSNSRGSKQRSFHGSTPLEPTPSSTQSERQYARRNNMATREESSSSPSKHSFHESSSSSRQHGHRHTRAASEQYSRSFSYSDDHRAQQHQEQHSHPPQDHHQSQSFSVNEQTNFRGDHNSDDRYQVNQLAKMYARGETPDRGDNADGRGDAYGDESITPSRLFSSSHEEDGRHQHRANHAQSQQQPSSNRVRDQKRYSTNDLANHSEMSSNRYNASEHHSPNDDGDNLKVNAKAKSVSMIVTTRDAEESMSPAKKSSTVKTSRKSKKSSKKSSREGDERKHKSTRSKSKVRDPPSSGGSEAMGVSLRSSESSDRASSPERPHSFNNLRPRFPKRRTSIEKHFNASSASGSVMNRLSQPLRSLKPSPSKESLRSVRSPVSKDSFQASFEYKDDPSDSPRRSTLDSSQISDEHESHTPQKQKKSSKLISRLVTSPTPQIDTSGSISIANDDDEHAVSLGIELALMNGDVPRLCDAKGRCLFHPHIRLQKPKLFGGWKILFKHCPDCAVEHMRATQDKMAEKKKKKRREKKNDDKKRTDERKKSDPIIAMNVGDDDFTPKKSKKKKKKHRDDVEKKEKEEAQELLESLVPAPSEPPMDEDYQSVMSDAVTNYDQPYQQESRAIVEHKPPRSKKVNGLPWSDYNGQSGRYTGEVNEQYLPHGRGEMVYDKGLVSAGIWYNGVLDTEEPVSMDGYVPHRLPNYEIGDKGTDDDMIITSKRETAAAVSQIRVNDAAFVRRSDGSWTYAIVKDQVDDGTNRSIRFKVNTRGSTKSFPPSQWGTYIRCINARTEVNTNRRGDVQAKRSAPGLGEYLESNSRRPAQPVGHSSSSVAGNFTGYSGDISVSSTHSAPVLDRSRSTDNLTTAKMRIKSRSRSRGRKNVTTLPLLFSSSMSVSEEAEDDSNDEWETASGSGYRLRGIDP